MYTSSAVHRRRSVICAHRQVLAQQRPSLYAQVDRRDDRRLVGLLIRLPCVVEPVLDDVRPLALLLPPRLQDGIDFIKQLGDPVAEGRVDVQVAPSSDGPTPHPVGNLVKLCRKPTEPQKNSE